MSEQLREHLSALMDGELSPDQTRFLLRRIDHDVQLAQYWSRYQIIGSVMRREIVDVSLREDFSQIVLQSIAESPRSGLVGGSRVLRWVGGGAIAAAVAVVALVATRPGQLGPAHSMESVATVPAATAVTAPIDLRSPVRPLPVLMNSNFAQPASYDTQAVPLPRYGGYDPDMLSRYSPYLLQPLPPRAQVISKATTAPAQPIQRQ